MDATWAGYEDRFNTFGYTVGAFMNKDLSPEIRAIPL
jgi:hypothetical protein